MTTFTSEAQFEQALINELQNKGWDSQVLKNPTEADLLKNWAQTLFQNNLGIDRLNNVPLTDSEMQQIIEQIQDLRTPFKLNGFINGTAVAIQKELIENERRLRRQRQEIFDVEDEIIEQRDALIDTLQQRMQEETETQTLFVVRWRVV